MTWLPLLLALAPLASATDPLPVEAPTAEAPPGVETIEVIVASGRYAPSEIRVPAGVPFRIRFVRKEWSSCTREVVFPGLGRRYELPPEQPVIVEFPASEAGEIPFHCGMHMTHGKIVVEAR